MSENIPAPTGQKKNADLLTHRDRFEASKDYEVNLKAEIELMALHHKIDTHLIAEIAALKMEVLQLREALRQKEQ